MLLSAFFLGLGIFSLSLLLNTTYKFIQFISMHYGPSYQIEESSPLILVLVDVCLILLFIVQHSVMTSQTLKMKVWPTCKPAYRCFYTIATSVALQMLMYFWQKTDIFLWSINTKDAPLTSMFFTLLHSFCWIILFLENTLTQPLYLIGIKQMYNYVKGYRSPKRYFSKPFQDLLSHMPHPGTTCFLVLLWVYPVMSLDRWLLATLLSMYMCKSYSVTHQDYLYTQQQIHTAQYMTISSTTTISDQ